MIDVPAFLNTLTNQPGVYRMSDSTGTVLYVGKARNLKKRLASYFRTRDHLTAKNRVMMSRVDHVEVTVTHTETEALILESNLIKAFRPRYNVVLRDDKSYPYIHLSTDESFPRLSFYRGPRRGAGQYFGPYPSAGTVRETLHLLQKLFQIRDCENSFFRSRSRPCLLYQIKQCSGPCVGFISEDAYREDVRHAVMFLESTSEEVIDELTARMDTASKRLDFEQAARYRDQIASLRRVQERQYVSGDRGDLDVIAVKVREGVAVVAVLSIRNGQNLGNKIMVPQHTAEAASTEVLEAFLPQYYIAGHADQQIPPELLINEAIPAAALLVEALSQRAGKKIALTHRVRGERARWLAMAEHNAVLALAQHLSRRTTLQGRLDDLQQALGLKRPPGRMECFDVSHSQGEATVASCVVFGPQGAIKSDYRRFNISNIVPGDDYGALAQALTRRYARLKAEKGSMPDILFVDGGKGQLMHAEGVLRALDIEDVLVVGVAKGAARKPGLESLCLSSRQAPLILPTDSPALHLVQQIRDEAHRFAIVGHRSRRGRRRNTSPLERVVGIGPKRRQRLLRQFGGLQGVARAGVEDLTKVKGIDRALAQAIYDAVRDG